MEFFKSSFRRIKAFFTRNAIERDMDREMRLHLELIAKEYEQSGMSPEDAQLAARRRFGNLGLIQERSRDIRGAGILDDLWRDFMYALHRFRRSPVFTGVIVLSLALGIGANTAMYSTIDAMFLRSLPVSSPDELVVFAGGPGRAMMHFLLDGVGFSPAVLPAEAGVGSAPGWGQRFRSTSQRDSAHRAIVYPALRHLQMPPSTR